MRMGNLRDFTGRCVVTTHRFLLTYAEHRATSSISAPAFHIIFWPSNLPITVLELAKIMPVLPVNK